MLHLLERGDARATLAGRDQLAQPGHHPLGARGHGHTVSVVRLLAEPFLVTHQLRRGLHGKTSVHAWHLPAERPQGTTLTPPHRRRALPSQPYCCVSPGPELARDCQSSLEGRVFGKGYHHVVAKPSTAWATAATADRKTAVAAVTHSHEASPPRSRSSLPLLDRATSCAATRRPIAAQELRPGGPSAAKGARPPLPQPQEPRRRTPPASSRGDATQRGRRRGQPGPPPSPRPDLSGQGSGGVGCCCQRKRLPASCCPCTGALH